MSSIDSSSIISTPILPIQSNLPSQATPSESNASPAPSYIHSPCDRLVTPYIEAGYLDHQGLINMALLKDFTVPFASSDTLTELIELFTHNFLNPSVLIFKNYITSNHAGHQPRFQVTLIEEHTIAYLHGEMGYRWALDQIKKVPPPEKLPNSVSVYLLEKPPVYKIHYSCSHEFIYPQLDILLNYWASQSNSKSCPIQWEYDGHELERANVNVDFTCMFTGDSFPDVDRELEWQLLFDIIGEQIPCKDLQSQSIYGWPTLAVKHLIGGMTRTPGKNQEGLNHFLQLSMQVGLAKSAEILKQAFNIAFGDHPAAATAFLFNLTLNFQQSRDYQLNWLIILNWLHENLPCCVTPPVQVVGHRDSCLALIQKLLKNEDTFKCTQAYLQLAPLWSLLFKDLDEQNPHALVTHLRPDNGQPTWRMRFGGASKEPIALWQPCDWPGLLQHLHKLESQLLDHPEVDQDLYELYFHVQPPLETTSSIDPTLLSHHLPLFQLSPLQLRTLAHQLIHSKTSSLKLLGQTLCCGLYLAYQERCDLDLFLQHFSSFYAAFKEKGKGDALLQWLQQIVPHVRAFSLLTPELQPLSPHQNWVVALAKSPNKRDAEIALELLKREQSPKVFASCFSPISAQHPDLIGRLSHISFPYLPIEECIKYLKVLNSAPPNFKSLFAPQLLDLVRLTLSRAKDGDSSQEQNIAQLTIWESELVRFLPGKNGKQISPYQRPVPLYLFINLFKGGLSSKKKVITLTSKSIENLSLFNPSNISHPYVCAVIKVKALAIPFHHIQSLQHPELLLKLFSGIANQLSLQQRLLFFDYARTQSERLQSQLAPMFLPILEETLNELSPETKDVDVQTLTEWKAKLSSHIPKVNVNHLENTDTAMPEVKLPPELLEQAKQYENTIKFPLTETWQLLALYNGKINLTNLANFVDLFSFIDPQEISKSHFTHKIKNSFKKIFLTCHQLMKSSTIDVAQQSLFYEHPIFQFSVPQQIYIDKLTEQCAIWINSHLNVQLLSYPTVRRVTGLIVSLFGNLAKKNSDFNFLHVIRMLVSHIKYEEYKTDPENSWLDLCQDIESLLQGIKENLGQNFFILHIISSLIQKIDVDKDAISQPMHTWIFEKLKKSVNSHYRKNVTYKMNVDTRTIDFAFSSFLYHPETSDQHIDQMDELLNLIDLSALDVRLLVEFRKASIFFLATVGPDWGENLKLLEELSNQFNQLTAPSVLLRWLTVLGLIQQNQPERFLKEMKGVFTTNVQTWMKNVFVPLDQELNQQFYEFIFPQHLIVLDERNLIRLQTMMRLVEVLREIKNHLEKSKQNPDRYHILKRIIDLKNYLKPIYKPAQWEKIYQTYFQEWGEEWRLINDGDQQF